MWRDVLSLATNLCCFVWPNKTLDRGHSTPAPIADSARAEPIADALFSTEVSRRSSSQSSLYIFALLGPPIGGMAMVWLAGAEPITLPLLLAALMPAYALGLGPALVVAALDALLTRRGVGPAGRLLGAPIGGAACGLLLLAPLYAAGLVRGASPLSLCLVAACTAMLCVIVVLLLVRPLR